MTKKLIILFVAMGVTCICRAQVESRPIASSAITPVSAYVAQIPPLYGIKTNLAYWGTLTPNLGVEVGLTNKITLNLTGGYNPWNRQGTPTNNKKFVHWIIEPEGRYWFCERFNGASVGVHALFSQYNISEHEIPLLFKKEFRYEGTAYGGGVSINYHYMLTKHLGVEGTFGIGFAFLQYEKYDCEKCSTSLGPFQKSYMGPTKIGINLIYVIK